MELGEAKRALDSSSTMACKSLGFARQAPLTCTRSRTSDEFILFGVRKDARGYFAVTASVAMKFKAISKLLDGTPNNGIHINVPLHMLSPDRKFSEWQFSDVAQLESIVSTITTELNARALPFFDSFGTSEGMRDRLRSEFPKDWFSLTGEQRIELLAALEASLGNQGMAVKLLDEALSHLRDGLPKKRFSLEALRVRVAGGSM